MASRRMKQLFLVLHSCSCSHSRLPPTGPAKDFHLQLLNHARRTATLRIQSYNTNSLPYNITRMQHTRVGKGISLLDDSFFGEGLVSRLGAHWPGECRSSTSLMVRVYPSCPEFETRQSIRDSCPECVLESILPGLGNCRMCEVS